MFPVSGSIRPVVDSVQDCEMDHTCPLVKQIGSLLLNDQFSDIALIVEGDVLPAHKVVLASSCEYFR